MRIVLVGAEFEENLAVRYIRAALEREGHAVTQLVFNQADAAERVAGQVARSGATLAGYSLVFTARAREFVQLMALARQRGFRGYQVAGGHFAAFHAEQLLRDVPALDAVACGEGEQILCELARTLDHPERVAGLVLRHGDGVRRGARAVNTPDLDCLAPPTRKHPPDTFLGLPVVNMLASRGCTHGCAFCSIAAWHRLCGGERLRLRRPAAVAAEMAALYRKGVRIFNFHDDNFLFRPREACLARLELLAGELRRLEVGRIAFAIKCRPDDLDRELLELLRSIGLFRVFLGIEAGSAEALRRLGRTQRLEDNVRALDLLQELGIHTCFNLLLLNPDSTLEDLAANVAFLRQHPANPTNCCRAEVYSGTPLERRLRRQGRLLGDYWGYHYTIADVRAQRAFELFYPVFKERNFSQEGLHHLAMQVDYEHQLLAHFFGTSARLRRRVKGFIVRVNENTCDHLERVVAAARGAAGPALPLVVRRLRRSIAADDRRLSAAGERLIGAIHAQAREARATEAPLRNAGGAWIQRAAAAGLVATLSLGGCKKVDSSKGEIGSQVYEMVAQPLEGDPALIKEPLGELLLPALAPQLEQPVALRVTVALNRSGQIASCTVTAGKARDLSCPKLVFVATDKTAAGRVFRLSYTEQEVTAALEQARPRPADSGPTPDLPRPDAPPPEPPRRPPTHPHEMIPRPVVAPTKKKPAKPKKRPKPKKPKKPRPKGPPKRPSFPNEMAPGPALDPNGRLR